MRQAPDREAHVKVCLLFLVDEAVAGRVQAGAPWGGFGFPSEGWASRSASSAAVSHDFGVGQDSGRARYIPRARGDRPPPARSALLPACAPPLVRPALLLFSPRLTPPSPPFPLPPPGSVPLCSLSVCLGVSLCLLFPPAYSLAAPLLLVQLSCPGTGLPTFLLGAGRAAGSLPPVMTGHPLVVAVSFRGILCAKPSLHCGFPAGSWFRQPRGGYGGGGRHRDRGVPLQRQGERFYRADGWRYWAQSISLNACR